MKKSTVFLLMMSVFSFYTQSQVLLNQPQANFENIQTANIANQNVQLLTKNSSGNTKAIIWSSNMSNASQWLVANDPSATLTTEWQWKSDTSQVSPNWQNYVGPYMGSATPMNGIFYFDGITNLINSNYGVENATLKNATPFSTIGHPYVKIKFYQLYKSYNEDSTFIEISSDNINWYKIDVNKNVAVNQFSYGWKEYMISQWAGNKPNVWIRFRFFGPYSTNSGPQYGGGYGWMIDDVSIEDIPYNSTMINQLRIYDAYSQVPLGQNFPFKFETEIFNNGVLTQNNIKLHTTELTSNTTFVSTIPQSVLSGFIDTISIDSIYLPNAAGDYYLTSWISSDSLSQIMYNDTVKVTVNNNNLFARDNNTYTGSRWAGTYSGLSDPYIAANEYKVKQLSYATGVNFVVSSGSKVGSKVKVVLYKLFAQSGMRVTVAQSNNYYLTAADIPTTTGVNPVSVTLNFTAPLILDPDSIYYAGVQVYGGTDTVKIAMDNTSNPQWEQTSLFFDLMDNSWYIWQSGIVPAVMIRLNALTLSASNPYFYITPSTQNVGSMSNSSATFSVLANLTTWSASTTTPWLNITTNTTTGIITATANSANTTLAPRTATITVNASGFPSQTLTVIQQYDPPFLNVYPQNITLSQASGISQVCNVYSNINWTASTTSSWLNTSYNVTSGTITISTTSSNNGTVPRSATVEVTGPGITARIITVTQICTAPFFSVTPSQQTVAYYAYEYTNFNIITNVTNWSATTNATWLNVYFYTSSNYIGVNTVEDNLSINPRSATIIIIIPGLPQQTVTVVQDGSPTNFIVSPLALTIADTSGSNGLFNVTTLLTGWNAYSNDAWLNVAVDFLNNTIEATAITANTTTSLKYGSIAITYNGTLIQTLVVVQAPPSPFIFVYPTNQYLPMGSGISTTFNVNANTQYSINSSESWLDVVSTKSDGTITATTNSPNLSSSPRTAEIYVKGGSTLEVLTVTQNNALSVNEISNSFILLYPNPADHILNIDCGEWTEKSSTISVFSITGQEVLKFKNLTLENNSLQINVASLSKGMYFVQINNSKQTIIKKFIKE